MFYDSLCACERQISGVGLEGYYHLLEYVLELKNTGVTWLKMDLELINSCCCESMMHAIAQSVNLPITELPKIFA